MVDLAIYGGGFIDVISELVYEFELPMWGEEPDQYQLHSYDGRLRGLNFGFKGKLDYDNKLWGLAGRKDLSDSVDPTVIWRASIDPVTKIITLDIVDLPILNEDDMFPLPNQLTIDYLGNVYFNGGSELNDDNYPVIIKGVVSEGPFGITYTITAVPIFAATTHCVTLSPSHDIVYTHVMGNENTPHDYINGYNTNNMALSSSLVFSDINENFTYGYVPQNMETDVNLSSNNFGCSYEIIDHVNGYYLIAWGGSPYAPGGAYTEVSQQEYAPETICIEENHVSETPIYFLTERQDNSPNPDICIRVAPIGGRTVGIQDVQSISQPISTPTHADIDRDSTNQDYYTGCGVDSNIGFIRNKYNRATGAERDLAIRIPYSKVCIACRREIRVPPV